MEELFAIFKDNALLFVLVSFLSYIIGSINCSIIVSKSINNKDIRECGSGNAGATNMLRSYGKRAAILTFVGDLLKSMFAVFFAKYLAGQFITSGEDTALAILVCGYLAGFFCSVGHLYPIWFGFRGGKGVVATLGLSIVLDWRVAITGLVVFAIVVALTRYVSLSSILAGVCMLTGCYLYHRFFDQNTVFVSAVLAGMLGLCVLLVTIKHIPNIVRLIKGTESKVHWRKAAK